MLRKCAKCGYTMHEDCPKCRSRTRSPHPPKFSSTDKYGKYRRMAKK